MYFKDPCAVSFVTDWKITKFICVLQRKKLLYTVKDGFMCFICKTEATFTDILNLKNTVVNATVF